MRLTLPLSILALFLLLGAFSRGYYSKEYPRDYFRPPVDKPMYLSGTFGELRSNHFHSGIDIKAYGGKTGQPILACAEGYVSRIKVEAGGYGNALYVDHPNGYTTVYAHLKGFYPEIEEYVKAKQYEKRTFEVNLYPEAGQFPVEKGQQIGKLGLTGTSFGPHLHFEIRETKSEKTLNPLHFGFKVRDDVRPFMTQLRVYGLNKKREALDTRSYDVLRSGKGYRVSGDTLVIDAWRAGFAIKTYDKQSGTSNWNGVYRISLFENDSLIYRYQMDGFHFDETRYINAHLDYEEQITKKSYFNRCYLMPGNELSVYQSVERNGVVELYRRKATEIRITSEDIEGNMTELRFWVKRGEVDSPASATFNYLLPWDEPSIIENGDIRMYFPKGCLYENLYLQYSSSSERSSGVYSNVYHIQDYKTPVHSWYDIAIQPVGLPEGKRDKAFIAYCDDKNRILNCGGEWKEDGRLATKVRDLGDFSIMVDEVAPVIKPITFRTNMRGYNRMTFKITDNYETARNVEGLRFDATIDGKWILMEFDKKNDLLTHRFDGRIPPGEHDFKLKVKDAVGNETVIQRKITL
jgi:murein DD-endopeptidase MepM/ murein hydrolase activator NlpD